MGINRLSNESSLYLKQHAENPVHWWPWCDEAFEAAEREGKPVLVSIGYSSCHWCHVMAHECFEDGYIADLMNRMFINIKVDREERPDVDQIYMEAIQMLNQQGGWPLNVFCFPDKKPFTGGTYFPPDDRGHGLIPWPHLLLRVSDAFQYEKESLKANADAIQKNMVFLSGAVVEEDRTWEPSILLNGARAILETLDSTFGGFGDAPKFPPSQMMGYLMSVRRLLETGENESSALRGQIDEAIQLCCRALVRGGLLDHVGGGFYRYSVDAQWRVPHFEKMLYDNALIIEALSKAWSLNRWVGLEGPIRKSVEWLLQDFQALPGVFASALDADSDEGEGAYYLWTEDELREAISGVEVEDFLHSFSIRGKDPLNLYPWFMDDDAYRGWALVLNDLKALRENRPMPGIDRKILISWNALMLRSLAVSGFLFDENRWLNAAQRGLDWIWEHMRREDGSLLSVYYPGIDSQSENDGFLDDYVNFALANVQFSCVADSLRVGLSEIYLKRSVELMGRILERFKDHNGKSAGFFFCSESGAEQLIVRKKEWFDNAYPSGNSSVVHLLSLLGAVDSTFDYLKELDALRDAYIERSRRMPNGIAYGMEGLTWDTLGIVTFKVGSGVDLRLLGRGIRECPWRPFWMRVDGSLADNALQVCCGQHCFAPVFSIEEAVDIYTGESNLL